MKTLACALTCFAFVSTVALADDGGGHSQACSIPASTVNAVQSKLAGVVNLPDHNGGLFTPNMMWSAVVDRQGILCSVIKTGDAWPGSRAIAIAKAETANDFSNVKLALSTANIYGPTQPGGSLYGLNNSNPFNPFFNQITTANGDRTGVGANPGGIITFGGGVALYQNGQVIGGLGVSGDTSCADHAIAFRMRKLAGLDGTPGGAGSDNIQYYPAGTTITTLDPSQFAQPHCSAHDVTP
jgi:uncharacterized protein GlcG (DUF336 family)